jgi:hypothetical protein
MRDVMVDLETLGTVPGFAILSIGAVAFDEDGLYGDDNGEGFYAVVHRPTCVEAFLTVCPETLKWWEKKSEDARQVLTQSLDPHGSLPLAEALERFNVFLSKFGGRQMARVWGNGSDFDNAGLACAYDAAKVRPGWSFWNNRCYRTFKNLARDVEMEREGTYHNAFDDARSQALHLVKILKAKGLTLG